MVKVNSVDDRDKIINELKSEVKSLSMDRVIAIEERNRTINDLKSEVKILSMEMGNEVEKRDRTIQDLQSQLEIILGRQMPMPKDTYQSTNVPRNGKENGLK